MPALFQRTERGLSARGLAPFLFRATTSYIIAPGGVTTAGGTCSERVAEAPRRFDVILD